MPNEMLTKLIPAITTDIMNMYIYNHLKHRKRRKIIQTYFDQIMSIKACFDQTSLPASIAIMITPNWSNNDDCCVGFDNNVKCVDGERGGGEEILDGGLG